MTLHRMRVSSLALALLAATGCGNGQTAAAVPATAIAATAATDAADANLVAAQIADTLQACSYDGRPVQFGMGGEAPRDCRDMIAQVMAFTGLPQNFDVTEADVPNAAAAILLDAQKLPHRVIAFNPEFIELVRRATGGNPWSAVSIMAHEAGHHLAGHTIQPGGSQPPIELEADKFSGFVLYKMGASRGDALTALNALVPAEAPAGSTHPARRQRVAALTEGWDQACVQTGRGDCASGTPGSAPPPGIVNTVAQSPVARERVTGEPAPAPQPSMRDDLPAAPPAAARAPATELPTVVVLPDPDPKALPSKGTQFIYDEYGILDPKIVADFEAKMYDHAKQWGVEIVTMLVKDLHGMSAEEYGWAMLRQLRVGKLDLGNGGVFVVAPNQGTSGVALAPGVARQLEFSQPVRQFDGWIREFWQRYCNDADGCASSSGGLLNVVESQVRALRSSGLAFKVRFESIQDILDYTNARQAERRQGRQWDDKLDQTIGSLVRFSGTVSELDPKPEFLRVNEATIKDGRWRAVLVKTDDGKETTLYMQPRTEQLMPGGTLRAGQRYTFTGQLKSSGQFHTDEGVRQGNVELWLFSYDPLQ